MRRSPLGSLEHQARGRVGGFFDGIFLHQILQRHHLLSLVPGAADQPFITAVFRPGFQVQDVFAALKAVDARLVWSDREMGVTVVAARADQRWRFYRHGAWRVSGSGTPAGCFNRSPCTTSTCS